MRVLLDTNVAIRWAEDRGSLRPEVDELLMAASTARLLSPVVPGGDCRQVALRQAGDRYDVEVIRAR